MPSSGPPATPHPAQDLNIPDEDLLTFTHHLSHSNRILVLSGAGLSASSGLPTFRGLGGYWRSHEATSLATPEAFAQDPSLVWQFYSYRRHMAFAAAPNAGHTALAELCKRKEEAFCVSQNVDGLAERAGHPQGQLALLHGSLGTVRCSGFDCDFVETENYTDPIVPALELPEGEGNDIGDPNVPLGNVPVTELPTCPRCESNLLRPGVVWFGEALPVETLRRVDEWMSDRTGIDLLIVVGTSAKVYPAAGYITVARSRGARVAVVNTERPDTVASRLEEGDWFFRGDAGVILPLILRSVIQDEVGG